MDAVPSKCEDDWSYADVMMYKYPYAKYMMGDQDEQCPAEKNPPEWAKWKHEGIVRDMEKWGCWSKVAIMPTVGGGFGFSIISRN